MKLFCKHDWKIIVDKELKAPIDSLRSLSAGKLEMPQWALRSKYICIVKCIHCGKINKTVETNP